MRPVSIDRRRDGEVAKFPLDCAIHMHIHVHMTGPTSGGQKNALAQLPCACANLRRAARAVSRLYNRALLSQHIEITQFTLLMTLDRAGEVSQGKLGKLLAMDSTTLTRVLALLAKKGWIKEKEGDDRRFRIIQLTAAGRTKLAQSMPHWKKAQDRVQEALGKQNMNELGGMLDRVTAVVTGG
jgi:DNA-binding MarR family transcriptional regulator